MHKDVLKSFFLFHFSLPALLVGFSSTYRDSRKRIEGRGDQLTTAK